MRRLRRASRVFGQRPLRQRVELRQPFLIGHSVGRQSSARTPLGAPLMRVPKRRDRAPPNAVSGTVGGYPFGRRSIAAGVGRPRIVVALGSAPVTLLQVVMAARSGATGIEFDAT